MNVTTVIIGVVVAIIAAVGVYIGWLRYQNRKLRREKEASDQKARKSQREASHAGNKTAAATASDEDLLDGTMFALDDHDSRHSQ